MAQTKEVLAFLASHPDDVNAAVDGAEQVVGAGSGAEKAEIAVGTLSAIATATVPGAAAYAPLFQFLAGLVIKGVVAHRNKTQTMPKVTAPIAAPTPVSAVQASPSA
jgi:hypothetical protein